MEYEIVPSMLTVEKDLQEACNLIKDQVKSIHIDVMDGIFVEDKTFGVDSIVDIDTSLKKIVHLMCVEPESLVADYALAEADTIIFHIETAKEPAKLIQTIKELECKAGISLKPSTKLDKIRPFLKDLDVVLVMTVEPGKGGQKMMPEMLKRVEEIRAIDKKIDIEVDGGIDHETIGWARKAGANKYVVGTAIFGSKLGEKDPVKAILDLRTKIE